MQPMLEEMVKENDLHNVRFYKGDGAYIGMRASIIATRDIVIGESAYVGAMSLVNKSIPDGATAVGVSCRVISGAVEKVHL